MKRIFSLIVALLLTSAAFAQEWSLGLRAGSTLQLVGQCRYNEGCYVEARVGASWLSIGGINGDVALLHNWRVADMDWTPKAGIWFFDAGVGVDLNGHRGLTCCGVVGMARLGLRFKRVPLSLSLDYSPAFGPEIYRYEYYLPDGTPQTALSPGFNFLGLYNGAFVLTYSF